MGFLYSWLEVVVGSRRMRIRSGETEAACVVCSVKGAGLSRRIEREEASLTKKAAVTLRDRIGMGLRGTETQAGRSEVVLRYMV